MTCGRARRLLWPDGGIREATAEIVAAREHTSRCPLCRQFLEDMRRLGNAIREATPRPEAPVEMRERLFHTIAQARNRAIPGGTSRRRHLWAAGLAAALLAGATWLGLNLVLERGAAMVDPLGAVAEDHLRSQRHSGLVSSDSLEVARWLADRLPFAVEVPIFPNTQVKGARLLLVNRQSGAAVTYVLAGRDLSYYVFPSIASRADPGGGEIRVVSRRGYRVAAWDDGGLTHALVGALPGPDLMELANYCIERMTGRRALSAARPPTVVRWRPGSAVTPSGDGPS
jgi:anti-sigma factor RsiW